MSQEILIDLIFAKVKWLDLNFFFFEKVQIGKTEKVNEGNLLVRIHHFPREYP